MTDSTATEPSEPTRPLPDATLPDATRSEPIAAPGRTAAAPASTGGAAAARSDAAERERSRSAADAAPERQATPLTPERRARRGAIVAGAIALPLVAAGFVLLAVPLAIWQLATIVKTIVVVIANAVAGSGAASDANATLASIDPDAMSGLTLASAIVGAVLLVAGIVVSVLVLRAHGVQRPAMVTVVAVPMGSLVAAIVTATVGALGGLLFGTSDTVSQVLGNAAVGIALTAIASGVATIVTGALVWLWMRSVLHDRAATASVER